MKKDRDAILGSSQRLFAAQNAPAALTSGSDKLLSDSRDLFQAFTAFGSLRDKGLLGNLWISLVFGVLAIIAIVGLIFSINRAQRQRYETTMELNNRNQEAIMRLLDEMGSLAAGDLNVKATVPAALTGATDHPPNLPV